MNNTWTKSSFSNGASACVEVRRADDGMVEIRESDRAADSVWTSPEKWAAFVAGVKAGEFDL